MEVFRITKDAQQQHGLRHADYQRYRGYCSRRIRRLRKVLKIPQVSLSLYILFIFWEMPEYLNVTSIINHVTIIRTNELTTIHL